jgi:Mce-associated membrane protein
VTLSAAELAADTDESDDGEAPVDTAEAHAEDADADCVESSPEDKPRGGVDWRRKAVRWVAASVLAAVLALAGCEGWLLFQQHLKDVAAAQALDAAKKYAITLTSVDANAIDKNVTDVLDGATGEFKDMYTQSSSQLRQVLIDNKAAARGVVIEAAVKSASKNMVEVVLFVDQSVSNAAAPQPQLDRSRVKMTMEKVDGRWLASKVELP